MREIYSFSENFHHHNSFPRSLAIYKTSPDGHPGNAYKHGETCNFGIHSHTYSTESKFWYQKRISKRPENPQNVSYSNYEQHKGEYLTRPKKQTHYQPLFCEITDRIEANQVPIAPYPCSSLKSNENTKAAPLRSLF